MDDETRTIKADSIDAALNCSRDWRILERCEALGLSLLRAVQLAMASDSKDPQSLLRVLDLDFSTFLPMQHRRPMRWLWMAARTSSISYRGTLTEDALLAILLSGEVPPGFEAHIGHLLDEAPISLVVMAVEQAAQTSGAPIMLVWNNIRLLAASYSDYRRHLWL
ncbi:hypothetical protein [Paraburkholderia gardini]|uniref:hypothetical protein n=1 Tax=Paraburkholderia gardini TaxID=2823469 RepID=UPI001D67BB6E|nr:hypothetical protein [Paraburkholderia gardini]CAG4892654.1 hypothetical protein R69919_01428 [Paraburkholderia gardini]